MVKARTIPVEHVGQAYLELLSAIGVKHFFGVAGSDFTSIIDGFAKRAADKRPVPKPILVPHEFCAVSMAHGYYMVTGEPSVVMVHSTVGTGNAMCALINASRAHVPIVFVAGRPPILEQGGVGTRDIIIHWGQEAFDQGEMARQWVKWDYELRSYDQLETVVRRAFAIAMTEPRGPVYLAIPRDLLTQPQSEFTIHETAGQSGFANATAPYPDKEALRQVALLLAKSSSPLIITRSFGRHRDAVLDLVALAETFAAPVIENQRPEYVSFPGSHPLHGGFGLENPAVDPSSYLSAADFVLVIDCPVPWWPNMQPLRDDAVVVHIGPDPLHSRYPIWGFRADIALTGDSAETVRQLLRDCQRSRYGLQDRVRARFQQHKKEHDERRKKWDEMAEAAGAGPVAGFPWIARCIDRLKDNNTIVVQEYDLNHQSITFDRPGSYYGFSPSGGLGFGVGGALGVKLASPANTVVSLVGDGTYLLGHPTAAHMVSAGYNLPILWAVCNNDGWGALEMFTRILQGPSSTASTTNDFPLTRFPVVPKYEELARASGSWAESVTNPADLPNALARARAVVTQEHRQALLNISCARF